MREDDPIIPTIQADFGVELLATTGDSALFGALRKGGTRRVSGPLGPWESHAMGVWHFVAVTTSGENLRKIHTQQRHITRFQMAAALRQQDHFFTSPEYEIATAALWMPLRTLIYGRHKLSFVINGFGEFRLSESFIKEMKQDLPILEAAKERVRMRGEKYYLSRAKSAAGHPVEYCSEEILEAIAFEKLTVPRMTAGNFGIYSAFCTYRDFDTSIEFPDELIRELLRNQLEDDVEDYSSEEMPELFREVQSKILSKLIWGRGIDMDIDEAAPILAAGLASLTRQQRVQFMLMNGMHSAGLFLPLAVLTDLVTFEQYADYMCEAWQPDATEEQDRRIETSYIKLYGELAG